VTVSQLLGKWNFWRRANNRHGVHSPFIYAFLDKGLYRRDLKALPPQKRLLLAAADHFGSQKAVACDPRGGLAEWLKSTRLGMQWDEHPTDLFICDAPGEGLLAFLDTPELWKNDTVVFVGDLRTNPENHEYWERATRHPAVRIILETYPAGLLFFRVQQASQHFRIRI
jgi:hypothetical protein